MECHAPTATPEAIRRAALLFGFMLRADALLGGRISPSDAMRERHMRAHVLAAVESGERVAAVVGAFHANALLTVPIAEDAPKQPPPKKERDVERIEGSLVPYDYALFDSRSGYPAGVRDPALVQRLFELRREGRTLGDELSTLLVDIARAMRKRRSRRVVFGRA